MSWLWGSPSEGKKKPDPRRDLDPSLRAFLEKESPVKYESSSPSASPPPSATRPKYSDQISGLSQASSSSSSKPTDASSPSSPSSNTAVPTQSLFPDGRYAHLWSTYTPLATVEASNKSDQDRLMDLLEGYKHRKAEIGRAAIENCSLEQIAVSDCFRAGGTVARLTMCRDDNRKLNRCYMMQVKFLKALGYLSTFDRPPEVDERIQMRADTLYHQMLAQEAATEEARKKGMPLPTFDPILAAPSPPDTSTAVTPSTPTTPTSSPSKPHITINDLRPSLQREIRKRLESLPPAEREIEEKAIAAELVASEKLAGDVTGYYDEQERARRERKETGKETMGDRLWGFFRWY
ncbi:MAG: hypothetical protein M1817_000140 [Caeruleum heppii]|nr:MAG: hypothetical protein M1817_000140 [Caeruleum heppii]